MYYCWISDSEIKTQKRKSIKINLPTKYWFSRLLPKSLTSLLIRYLTTRKVKQALDKIEF